jgi:hypothetical protein
VPTNEEIYSVGMCLEIEPVFIMLSQSASFGIVCGPTGEGIVDEIFSVIVYYNIREYFLFNKLYITTFPDIVAKIC